MITEFKVRQHLAAFVRGAIDLDALEDWIVQHSWGIRLDDDSDVSSLVGQVELALAEHSSGHRSAQELRDVFLGLLSNRSAEAFLPFDGITAVPRRQRGSPTAQVYEVLTQRVVLHPESFGDLVRA